MNSLFLEHFFHPQNTGTICADPANVLIGQKAITGGDIVIFQVVTESEIVTDVRYQVQGSAHTIAACSWLSAAVKGREKTFLATLTPQAIAQALNFPPTKLASAIVAYDAIKHCLGQSAARQ